jgi:hypothetical protein
MGFDQIVEDLYTNLHPDSAKWLQEHTEKEARGLHHGFGTAIRNEYGLWAEDHPLTGLRAQTEPRDIHNSLDYSTFHPDAVSNEIIAALWRKANSPTQVKT